MKKVLLTINNNRLSGIERFTVLLAKYIDKTKFQVSIGVPTYGPICDILKENNIDYFIFNNKRNGKFSISGIIFLFKKILNERYDVIHAQAGIAPCLIGKLLGIKLLIEHKHGLDFTLEQINNMKLKRLIYERMKKYLVNYTITCCKNDKIVLLKRFNYKDNKVFVVYYGIEKIKNNSNPKANIKFTIGTAGRLTYQKGQEYFIEMARELKQNGYNFEYHIYGGGEKIDEFSDLIKRYRLENNVFIKGYTDDISKVMNTFDIFVLPSRYEGIPFVIFEAMRESLPIISTDVGGIDEVINNMENGILIRKEDVNELVNKTILLANDKELRCKLSKKATEDFNEKYSIDNTVKAIETVYEKNI